VVVVVVCVCARVSLCPPHPDLSLSRSLLRALARSGSLLLYIVYWNSFPSIGLEPS